MNKKVKQFLSHPFVINIGVAFLIVIVFVIGTLFWLDSYTRHGEKIMVPDLQGLDEKAAQQLLKEKKLKYEIIDSIFIKKRKPGTVKEQNPEAGAIVKEERKVYLTIYAYSPRKIVLPDLRDMSLRQAESIITSLGLKIGGYEAVPSEYKDLVKDVKYENKIVTPGTRITEGASIIIRVGKGQSIETSTDESLQDNLWD